MGMGEPLPLWSQDTLGLRPRGTALRLSEAQQLGTLPAPWFPSLDVL